MKTPRLYDSKSRQIYRRLVDMAITKLNGFYGVVNMNTGNVIVESTYNHIYTIGKRDSLLFCLRSDEGNRIINKEGKTAIPTTNNIIYPVFGSKSDNYLIQKQANDKKGIISVINKELIPCIYDDIYQLTSNLFRVELGDKVGIVDENNNVIFPIEFNLIHLKMIYCLPKKERNLVIYF